MPTRPVAGNRTSPVCSPARCSRPQRRASTGGRGARRSSKRIGRASSLAPARLKPARRQGSKCAAVDTRPLWSRRGALPPRRRTRNGQCVGAHRMTNPNARHAPTGPSEPHDLSWTGDGSGHPDSAIWCRCCSTSTSSRRRPQLMRSSEPRLLTFGWCASATRERTRSLGRGGDLEPGPIIGFPGVGVGPTIGTSPVASVPHVHSFGEEEAVREDRSELVDCEDRRCLVGSSSLAVFVTIDGRSVATRCV
jgi:hypothetical protein